jgi:hypothetical protein
VQGVSRAQSRAGSVKKENQQRSSPKKLQSEKIPVQVLPNQKKWLPKLIGHERKLKNSANLGLMGA